MSLRCTARVALVTALTVGAVGITVPAQAASDAPPTCTATVLPLPPGVDGQVEGTDGYGTYVGVVGSHGALWRHGALTDLGAGFLAWDLNRQGTIVGVAPGANNVGHAAVLRHGVITMLPEPAGAIGSFTRGIDEHGNVVGSVLSADFDTRAVAWPADRPGTVVMLSTPDDAQSNATGIDAQGRISGTIERFGQERGMVWGLDGAVQHPLQTFDPNAGQQGASAIVDGRVVGWEFNADFVAVPMQWDENGVPTPLAHTGDGTAFAVNHADVVGGSAGSDPVLWLGGEQVTLPTPPGTTSGAVTAVGDDNTLGGVVAGQTNVLPALWTCGRHRP